ncbi:MAG: trypsin-like serine protease, partial [Elusimicrobia bacterium]|nr:trypsin-like serine protease [Elusimicrobiota bacterium]
MRARTLLAALAAAFVCRTAAAGTFSIKGIYGADDRREPSQVESPRIRAWADSTVALFEANSVALDTTTGKDALTTQPFKAAGVQTPDNPWGQWVDLCPEERFKGQAQGAFCSGSLVAPDLVMTAGHCVDSEDQCKAGIKFVFGFDVGAGGKAPSEVPADQVYGCAQVVARQLDMNGPDFTLVRLDRPVK